MVVRPKSPTQSITQYTRFTEKEEILFQQIVIIIINFTEDLPNLWMNLSLHSAIIKYIHHERLLKIYTLKDNKVLSTELIDLCVSVTTMPSENYCRLFNLL